MRTGLTLAQTRQILREANRHKGGWWTNSSYTAENVRHRCGYKPDEWDAMTPMARHREIALMRADDTMHAWDAFSLDEKKKWVRWLLNKSE